MEIRFDKQYLEDLYIKGKSSDKKHRFQPQIVAKYTSEPSICWNPCLPWKIYIDTIR